VKLESEIERDLRLLEPLLDRNTVLVTHTPAFDKLDTVSDGAHVGSPSLAALLERKPVLAHIHGHIHGRFGRDGNHFNVAAAAHRRAVLIRLPALDWDVLGSV
jgi:Icc-related predicted phosphoesterase